MFGKPARIMRPVLPEDRRVIVISDIHGNLPYLKGLLKKIRYCKEDILILDGDFLEKGPDSLGTLRYIMELAKSGMVLPLLGNCDEWQMVFHLGNDGDAHIQRYFRKRRYGLLFEMLSGMGIDPTEEEHVSALLPEVERTYPEEWHFMCDLPHAIETEKFVFVHAGMDGSRPLEENLAEELTAREAFLLEGQHFDKWIVTGHRPVVLYGENIVNANPIIDEEHHILCLDGGCVLKDDGQLNALILPDILCDDASCFSCAAYDAFPTAVALDDQEPGAHSYYIRWGDSLVQVLRRGEEFSRCRHVRTGYEMDILTKYLFEEKTFTDCNDCTDYILPLRAGEKISIVERTSRGVFAKHNGVSGWYYGRWKEGETDA